MVNFDKFLKTWSLRSNSVTRQVSFNRTKIGGKCQNSIATFWVIFKQCEEVNVMNRSIIYILLSQGEREAHGLGYKEAPHFSVVTLGPPEWFSRSFWGILNLLHWHFAAAVYFGHLCCYPTPWLLWPRCISSIAASPKLHHAEAQNALEIHLIPNGNLKINCCLLESAFLLF